jgi:hypothetical protein
MPIYTYKHPKKEQYVDLVQGMNDSHEYTDEKGVKYERVFYKPNASVDTSIDPFSPKDFIKKTDKKGMTVGDMWDISAGLSAKRAKKAGIDHVKEKTIADYSKKCRGLKHPLADK